MNNNKEIVRTHNFLKNLTFLTGAYQGVRNNSFLENLAHVLTK